MIRVAVWMLASALAGCSGGAETPPPGSLTLVVQNRVDGEIEPCG